MMHWIPVEGPGAELLVHALGWTLLHFVWQGAIVTGMLWCVLKLAARRTAQMRYAASCIALLLMAILPMATFGYLIVSSQRPAMAGQSPLAAWRILAWAGAGAHGITLPWWERLAAVLDRCAPGVFLAWVVGFVPLLTRLAIGLVVVQRMKRVDAEPATMELQAICRELCRRMGVSRVVKLMQSRLVEAPIVIGWLRPVILLPVSALTGMSTMQIEALLAHELAHVLRQDYLISVMQSVVETALFYHPAVWWVSRQVRREREFCCDDMAVAVDGDELAYAKALSLLEERRGLNLEIALRANGGVLKMRIERLLGQKENAGTSQAVAMVSLVAVVAVSAGFVARMGKAQSVATTPAVTGVAHPGAARMKTVVKLSKDAPEKEQAAMPAAYRQWMNEDVAWIITPEERIAFIALTNDEERDHFIKQFWLRRDLKGEAAYSFRKQHYQRITYANSHFSGTTAGWATDRGHAYIVYGRPDSIDAHFNAAEPYETWHYGDIQGKGIDLKFVDNCKCGDFQLEGRR
jgi:GWxTD domain-containing protein